MPVTATSFGLSLFARHAVSTPYHPSDSWGLEGPLNNLQTQVAESGLRGSDLVTTAATKLAANIPANKSIPLVMAGMDKAEALAFVSRMFDAASAGAAIWGDPLLVKRFLSQCSRTGSEETIRGYRREIHDFMRWRDMHHPHLLSPRRSGRSAGLRVTS